MHIADAAPAIRALLALTRETHCPVLGGTDADEATVYREPEPANHLARDGREHAIELLDALNAGVQPVGRWWTLRGRGTSPLPSALKTKAMTKQGES